jgi:hypothetical protein
MWKLKMKNILNTCCTKISISLVFPSYPHVNLSPAQMTRPDISNPTNVRRKGVWLVVTSLANEANLSGHCTRCLTNTLPTSARMWVIRTCAPPQSGESFELAFELPACHGRLAYSLSTAVWMCVDFNIPASKITQLVPCAEQDERLHFKLSPLAPTWRRPPQPYYQLGQGTQVGHVPMYSRLRCVCMDRFIKQALTRFQ